ncbi:MAG: N-(5'-phosphoribosyl)anthranilate isomerase [Bacteroidetes bacterium 4572_117]|nr:MAG: N-(5'-phosphoribosyl)anthranilate isomerase [Bacteroidetes bacterium 4572_117]
MYKLKICGMKYPDNIRQLINLKPDFIGFIFYDKSKRFIDNNLNISNINISKSINKVGVFVNSSINYINKKIIDYKLDFIQLHGNESPQFCKKLQKTSVNIIKAFQIDEDFDFSKLKQYETACNYYLFDTKTKLYGGSGKKFNWKVLEKYDNKKPFFLSGGIDIDDVNEIKKLKNLNIYAIDINSKFEIKAGVKDIEKIRTFSEELRM